jgi:peptidoglycan/LPS O-acetylase OafA/YrhL
VASSQRHIAALTSLRFFAAAMIVALHSRGHFGIPKSWARDVPLVHGVSFFFVLSGFILTYAYPSLPDGDAIRRFWVARFARLWPTHLAAGALYVAARPHVLAILLTPFGLLDGVLFLLLLHAWVPLETIFFSFNPPSWSISTEAFFYLLFPFLIWHWSRTWHWKLALIACLAGVMMATGYVIGAPFHGPPDRVTLDGLIYISPFARVTEFILGMCAALIFARMPPVSARTATLLELAALAFVVWMISFGIVWFYIGAPKQLFGPPIAFFLQRTWCAPAFALLIVAVALQTGLIARLLSFSPLIVLGEISYVVYLVHQTVIYVIEKSLPSRVPAWLSFIVFLAATLALSWTIWRYVEMPCRKWIRNAYAKQRHMTLPSRERAAYTPPASSARLAGRIRESG